MNNTPEQTSHIPLRSRDQHLGQTRAGSSSHADRRPPSSQEQHTPGQQHGLDVEAGTQLHNDRFPQSKPAPLSFKDRAVRVTWGWFPCTMATGGMANLVSQQPYTFAGLDIIGSVFFLLNLVLFVVLAGLIALRFAMKPRALATSLHHPSESFYFGSFWVSIALILVGSQAYGGPATGQWFVVAMRLLFWLFYGCELVVAVFQYHVIFESERLDVAEALPSWILPAYPFLVTGLLAANIAQAQPSRSAIQMIIAGLMGQGLGWILSLFIYAVYLMRLIQHSLPDPSKRPGMYIAVGPASFTCAGLLSLGKQAKASLPEDFLGITSVPVGDLWLAMSVATALFLWLMAIWFSALATLSVLRESRHMTFTPSWWAFVFPNVGLALATISVGDALGSPAIQAVASAMTIVLALVWIFCAVSHVRAVLKREILALGKDMDVERVNDQHEVKKQRRLAMKENKRQQMSI